MSPRPSAVRRFTAVWIVSAALKLAALAVFLYLVVRVYGGSP